MVADVGRLKVTLGKLNVLTPGEFRRFLMSESDKYGWTWVEDRGFWSSFFVITGPSKSLEVLATTIKEHRYVRR